MQFFNFSGFFPPPPPSAPALGSLVVSVSLSGPGVVAKKQQFYLLHNAECHYEIL